MNAEPVQPRCPEDDLNAAQAVAGSEPVNDFCIRYYPMTILDLDDRFIVAKLRRVTSPPVRVGSVSDSMATALGLLADIIRLGTESRNYADLVNLDWWLGETCTTPAEE